MSADPKRYTTKEFSFILSKAAELADSSTSIIHAESGLTIAEIKSIAAEVGLDPHSVGRAARLVPDELRPSLMRRLWGGTFRVRSGFTLFGEFTEERAQCIVAAARNVLDAHGELDANATGLSWSTGEVGRVIVSAYGDGSETRVQVSVDTRRIMLMILTLGAAGVGAAVFAAIAAGDSGVANPYLILAGGGGITVAWVRSILRRLSSKTRDTFENLIGVIGDALERESAS